MAKKQKIKVICNSSPIINLSKIKRLNLLEKLYQRVTIPNAVFEELVIKGRDKENLDDIKLLIENNVIMVEKASNTGLIKALKKDLDDGEAEVIALAVETQAHLVVLDEKDARDAAEIYDLNKIGFLGILIKAREKGLIESVRYFLDMAIEQGFWIDHDLYRQIIEDLNES
jgi:predicted nucleic acid-binding protein